MNRDSSYCWCGNPVNDKDRSLCSGCNSYQGDCDCAERGDDY